jgi:predicted nucleic acid-binding protein
LAGLTFSAGDIIYLDTAPIIYTVEQHPLYAPPLAGLWDAASASEITVVSSELSVMEALVLPLRSGDVPLQEDYHKLFSLGVSLVPVSIQILQSAAQLRAQNPHLRTPDAIHLSTALSQNCSALVTNDRHLRSRTELPVILLSDLT